MSVETKPVGPYETFGECVAAMQNRGHSADSARRICGSMEADSKAWALLKVAGAVEVVMLKRRAVTPTRAQMRLARRLDRDAKVITKAGAQALNPVWKALGDRVADAFTLYLNPPKGRRFKDGLDFFSLAVSDDAAISQTAWSIENLVDFTGYSKTWLGRPYERIYQMAGEMTFGALAEHTGINVGWALDEPAAQRVLATGGTRRGLLDLRADTRSAVLGTMEEARLEGWGPPEAARWIRELVPAGRFWRMQQMDPARGTWPGGGVAYRSSLIARTETKYAQNVSAFEAGVQAGFDTFVVFDARIGPTDAECEAINGQIVDGVTARRLLEEEHPNGTRSISPVPRDAAHPPIIDVPAARPPA